MINISMLANIHTVNDTTNYDWYADNMLRGQNGSILYLTLHTIEVAGLVGLTYLLGKKKSLSQAGCMVFLDDYCDTWYACISVFADWSGVGPSVVACTNITWVSGGVAEKWHRSYRYLNDTVRYLYLASRSSESGDSELGFRVGVMNHLELTAGRTHK